VNEGGFSGWFVLTKDRFTSEKKRKSEKGVNGRSLTARINLPHQREGGDEKIPGVGKTTNNRPTLTEHLLPSKY